MDNITNKDLRKLQKCELEILKEFVRICNKYNLKYSLAFGTLLGAARHEGFIPWDDDIDVMMPIDDYKIFEEIVNKELNKKFFFQNISTDKNYYLYWDKIRMNNTISIVKGYEDIKINWGICIDIFPIFKVPLTMKEQQNHIKNLKLANVCLNSNLYKKGKIHNTTLKTKIFYNLINLFPRSVINKISNIFYKKIYNYNGKYDKYVDYCELYSRIIVYDKNIFDNMEVLNFEGYEFNVVNNYKKVLKQLYGDYMKLPPKEERVAHGNLILKFNKGKSNDE